MLSTTGTHASAQLSSLRSWQLLENARAFLLLSIILGDDAGNFRFGDGGCNSIDRSNFLKQLQFVRSKIVLRGRKHHT